MRIDFVGVFDTVASVGIVPRELPFTSGNRAIRVFRHALSLDERRVRFQPNHFHNPPRKQGIEAGRKIKPHQITGTLGQKDAVDGKVADPQGQSTTWNETDHMEVWFAGNHVRNSLGIVEVSHMLYRATSEEEMSRMRSQSTWL